MLAVGYTNMTFRNIDHASIVFTKNPLYFSIEFTDKLEIIRDSEGNIIYQEPKDGYVFLRKSFIDNYLPDGIKKLASKNINYKVVTYQSILWYRIYVPDFNRKYEWKKYSEPTPNEKWYTWGSDESIQFETRAMYVELAEEKTGSLLFSFTHPTDNSGQTIAISKSYFLSKGITKPYFEWGEVIPWKPIGYTENATHYFINPEHFSTIGAHEASSGTTTGLLENSSNPMTEIMRPESDEHTAWYTSTGTPGIHWEDVDEVTSDEHTTYVREDQTAGGVYHWDKYNHTEVFSPTYTNSQVEKVVSTARAKCVSVNPVFKHGIWTHGVRHPSSEILLTNYYTDYTYEWTTNPETGNNWTVDEVSNCAFGVGVAITGGTSHAYLTQFYFTAYFNRSTSFVVTRTVGATSEKNNFTFSAPYAFNGSNIFKVPVSTEVSSITEVYNYGVGIVASEVSSMDNLINNTYFYDSALQDIYICLYDIINAQTLTWSVNCSYGSNFSISIPTFKIVGDDLILQGTIEDADGIGIDGSMARTYVYYQNGSIAIGDDPAIKWNCTGGNFNTVISTTSLIPGIYSISIEFTDVASGVTFKEGETFYLSYEVPEGVGVYSDAVAIFNIYNTNLGLGLPKETLQVYVNDVRKKENIYYTYLGENLTITIKDYYNFTLITRNQTITEVYTFIDLGITFHEYDFTNMNDEYFYASFLKSGADRWYEKVVASTGQKAFLLPTGSYTIRVYNADNSSYTVWNDVINNSKAFLIGEAGVTVIIEGIDVVDEPIEWRAPPFADKSFVVPTKPPAYPEDPFTVSEMYAVLQVTNMPKSDAEVTVVFLDTGYSPRTYGGVDLSNIIAQKLPTYASAYDSHGHGTWVSYALASIFEAYLPNARLISFKVFDDEGACTKEQLIEAFDAVKKLEPDVVSFSGGAYGGPLDDISEKVNELRSEGIIVVCAAGNLGPASGTILSPASSKGAICVGAIDPKDTLMDRDDDVVTSWSSRGPVPSVEPKPDFVAPGESIRGPWMGGQATISGTSAATPLVAAGIAIMYGNNKGILDIVDTLYFWDNQVVPNILEGAMVDTAYQKGNANDYGWGIPDFDKANDAVNGKALILIIIWFVAIIVIAIVVIIAVWYWWPWEWVYENEKTY